MSLQDLELKGSYDSEEDDIIENFYIPALSESVIYRRLAGFFSSSALAVAARGLASFISNDGHMELIVGSRLQKADIAAIREGLETPEKVIEKMMLEDLEDIQDAFIKDHVRALAWMIANRKLEIKVAIVIDEKGEPLDEETLNESGLFHMKVGILLDREGNRISFSGSVNESATAWQRNVEEFKVFRSWIDGESEHLRSDIHKFEKYWFGNGRGVRVINIPDAVEQKLIQIAPESITELKLTKSSTKSKPKLREYQSEAIQNWFNNECSGIFEMATGTGKTFTAIGCIDELYKKNKFIAAVIVSPYKHLVTQWNDELDKFNLKSLSAFGNTQSWIGKLSNEIMDFNNGYTTNLIITTTYDSFYSEAFINAIKRVKNHLLLVADEVHGSGAPERRKGLMDFYKFRLGLSATPRRWLDDEGTEVIENYFGKTVYEFSLSRAIKEGFLTPYEYYPHFVELDSNEYDEYEEISKRISVEYARSKTQKERQKIMELLLFKRQNIIVNAVNKLVEFENMLDLLKNMEHCLIYCSPQQIDNIQEILNKRGILQHKFTQIENIKERQDLLDNFALGKYKVLVAMKILDEGVDVPPTRIAIILASSGNPRQYIQRRGRVLRKYPGKDKAIIHDIIVVPTIQGNIPPECFELEKKILEKELKRYKEFARSSMNPLYALNKIFPIIKKYHIMLED